MRSFLLVWLLPVLILFSCDSKKRKSVERGFYYWKSKLKFEDNELELLRSLKAKRMYVKFFDVDWDEKTQQPLPYATIQPELPSGVELEIVPTVYITNATLAKTENYQLYNLEYNMYRKIKELLKCFTPELAVGEVQIDCDWSEQTREKYFKLLSGLKQRLGNEIALSATIRLHQVKYFEKTGVPPVDKGMLMFYNMGEVTNANANNSIFNSDDASKYLYNFDTYPLKLDIALPVFSWVAVYRKDKLVQLITDFENSLKDTDGLTRISGNSYKAIKNIELRSAMIRPGDQVRFEVIGPEQAEEAAALIEPYLKSDSLNVVLFDFNPLNLKRFSSDELEDIYQYFD